MINDDECGVVGRMTIGRGNRSTRRKPAPVPLCPPQIPYDLTWALTPITAVAEYTVFLERLVFTYKTTRCHNPEENNLNTHSLENFEVSM
jgi:hypothetical protein